MEMAILDFSSAVVSLAFSSCAVLWHMSDGFSSVPLRYGCVIRTIGS